MNNVASLELCKELYELSGWRGSPQVLSYHSHFLLANEREGTGIPAYDLGYLLRKLPNDDYEFLHGSGEWYFRGVSPYADSGYCDTPEDAAAKVAIKLFKQGILQKEVV
jgi:hypothetical protein